MVIAFVFSIHQVISQRVKKIYKGKSENLAISFFRQGLSSVKAKIWNLKKFIKFVEHIRKEDLDSQGKWLYIQY